MMSLVQNYTHHKIENPYNNSSYLTYNWCHKGHQTLWKNFGRIPVAVSCNFALFQKWRQIRTSSTVPFPRRRPAPWWGGSRRGIRGVVRPHHPTPSRPTPNWPGPKWPRSDFWTAGRAEDTAWHTSTCVNWGHFIFVHQNQALFKKNTHYLIFPHKVSHLLY